MLGHLLEVIERLVVVVALIDRAGFVAGDEVTGIGAAVVVVIATTEESTEKRIHEYLAS
jgi:hypothetical protein